MAGELCVVLGTPHTLDLHPWVMGTPPRWWGAPHSCIHREMEPPGDGDPPGHGNPPWLFGTPWLMGNFLGNGKPPIPTPPSGGDPPQLMGASLT